MSLNIHLPQNTIMMPEITVFGVGGAGGNATNNMTKGLDGVNFVIANTDAQALGNSVCQKRIQLGQHTTQGLGAGALPAVGAAAAEEAMDEIVEHLSGSHMVFITAGMGGGTGTGAAPVIARAARELGILTVGVVTKPFHFEGPRRMKIAEEGLKELQKHVDTLIVIPNQNLFRIANEKTTFADAFKLADDVLHRGVRGVTDLMVMPGLINLDFADVKAVMSEMGKAMMGTGEASGERRAKDAAEAAISNPLLDNISMKGARGVLINITGGPDMTLFEVDEAANRVREEVDASANIIFGSTFNEELEGKIRVSVVATGIDAQQTNNQQINNVTAQNSNVFSGVDANAFENVEQNDNESSEELEDSVPDFSTEAVLESDDFTDSLAVEQSQMQNPFVANEDVKAGNTPSNVDEEYYAAIKKLNEEYQEKLGSEKQDKDEEDFEDSGLFVATAPRQPADYGANNFDKDDNFSDYREKAANPIKYGGIFSRMAKAARGLHATGGVEDKEDVITTAIPQVVKNSSSVDKEEEDLMDIPAFLRRKA